MFINPERIKNSRVHRGWTQQQLADVSGLSLRTIQRVENQGQGSLETTNALCAVLEIEREHLFAPNKTVRRLPMTVIALLASGLLVGFGCGVLLMFLLY